MTVRPCLGTPGEPCGELTKRTRCPSCESKRNIARGSSHQRGYTRRHRDLSERYRRSHPLCELRYPGCEGWAVDADHRVPIRPSAGGKSVWSNYEAACRPCHARKTREDAERYPLHV